MEVSRLSALRQFTMTIPADPAAISIVTDGVVEMLKEKDWPKEDVLAVQLALQEAVANAIRHGCRGDVSKQVQCSVTFDASGELVIVVRDPGSGFDPGAIADPLDTANLLKPSGRGILLINELMDHVQFADGGREVQMRKRKALERMSTR
jgi:serine/threonine-protein kinase RsbW